ncbi:DUF4403 family protein [Algoriphagus vanfongensis]|uniref:DUF4403 family protein n=1 Tax=Algoriphagus vanfongensis TaxID=426371 RepID=UPI00047DA4C3|nr:DUF4403 family protein [Algoriphagus vanfongensis]
MKHTLSIGLQKYSFWLVVFSFSVASCKSLDISNPGPMAELPPSESQVNVPFEIPKSTLDRIFNSQIPVNLINEESMDFGSGIEGNLNLRRSGTITYTALDSQRIELKMPLEVRGEVGLKRGGLGNLFKGKVPIEETFAPIVRVNPQINPDWTLSVDDFELVELGGSLTLDVLGMEVDLSQMMERQIRSWAENNLHKDRELVNLKPMIELAWQQAGKAFTVDWDGNSKVFSIQPEAVKLKEFFGKNESYHVWLGMSGKINTHPVDAAPSRAFPLPGLTANKESENFVEIELPFDLSYQELDQLLGENLNGRSFKADKKTIMTLDQVRSQPFGELLAITCDFVADRENGDELAGSFFVVGKPSYDSDSQSLYFDDINFKVISEDSKAKLGIALKKRKIIRQIEKRAVFPVGSLLEDSMSGIQDRLAMSVGIADLQVDELEVEPSGFYPTQSGITVMMKAKGKIDVTWK